MTRSPEAFIGREEELQALQRMHQAAGSHIAVIYGRRRVGKTALINRAFQGQNLLSFEGIEGGSKRKQIGNFLFQLEEQTGIRIDNKSAIKQWREAFVALLPALKDKNTVLLLDELQWMAHYRSDLVSDLKMVWEQYLVKAGEILLVLCGSIASFMEQKVIRSKALYGRTSLSIHLKPFLLSDTRQFLAQHSEDDVLLAQLVVGGIPEYLNLLSTQPSIAAGIDALAFSENGYFNHEFDRIFVSHFGESDIYQHIIAQLAANPYGLSRQEIQGRLKLAGGGELTRNLRNLESAGFIASFTPFDRIPTSPLMRYVIEDPFMRFYFAFLSPYKRKGTHLPHYFTNFVLPSPEFRSWLGRSFELLCLQHSEVIAKLLGFSGIQYTAGPYFQHGQRGVLRGAQLDLVFARGDRVITVCEAKYRAVPIGIDVMQEVEEKLGRIPALENKTVQKVLLTKSDPSTELLRSSYFSKIIKARDLLAN